MADITCDCAGELDLPQFPCKGIDYGYPTKLVLGDPNGALTVAGETPTLAEIQAGINDTGEDRLIVIEEITNGQRNPGDIEQETGADTADGLADTFGINMVVTGRIKRLDEALRTALAQLNCQSRLKMWFITNKGYIFGGKTGYLISNFLPPLTLPGFGAKPFIDLNLVYSHNLRKDDPAGYDAGFLTITNPETT